MLRTSRHPTRALAALACSMVLAAPAGAQLRIRATSIPSGNVLHYSGLGDLGGGLGHGVYQLGNCAYNGVDRTYCTAAGSYVETAASVHPGTTGTFVWRMSWVGSGANPIQARSDVPGSNQLVLSFIPPGAYFEIFLNNGLYATLDPPPRDTPNPTGGLLGWQAFASPGAVCTGGPAACTIGSVGLTNGATFTSPISTFTIQLNYPGNVLPTTAPEPASIGLVAVGLVALGARGYRRRTHDA